MAYIDEIMKDPGTASLGITYEQPKAHENIDKEIDKNTAQSIMDNMPPEHLDLIQGLVMGIGGGGGAAKGVRQLLLAMKGKIKGGKMIPSQPFRQGIVGGGKKGIPSPKRTFPSEHEAKWKQHSAIDDILKSVQQSERYVNYKPGFLQSLIDKFKKTF